MNHMDPIFQDPTFYWTKKVPRIHNQFCHFRHRGGTHFLVLAQTLIYPKIKLYLATTQNYSIITKFSGV